jgi:hypothetical protein
MDDEIVGYILGYLINVTIWTFILFISMRMTKVEGKIAHLIIACAISGLLRFIPLFGLIFSFVSLWILISIWTDAEFWPDAAFMVIVAWGIGLILGAYLAGMTVR